MGYNELWVFTDGGSRGNPGPAGVGVYICEPSGHEIMRYKKYIGKATNNIAEYTALAEALNLLKKFEPKAVKFHLDSELVVKQLNGEYRVKDENLRKIFYDVKSLLVDLEVSEYEFVHVRRERNAVADALVNCALDEEGNS